MYWRTKKASPWRGTVTIFSGRGRVTHKGSFNAGKTLPIQGGESSYVIWLERDSAKRDVVMTTAGREKIGPEVRLLAAMAYGEAATANNSNEIYALASVLKRQRDARGSIRLRGNTQRPSAA